MRTKPALLGIVWVSAILMAAGDLKSPIPQGVRNEKWFPASQSISPEEVWQDGQINALTQFFFYFWRIEGRAPNSLAEMEARGYFLVPRSSFLNPVTGDPIRILEAEPATPEPWDIAINFGSKPQDLRILWFYPKRTENGVVVQQKYFNIGSSLVRIPHAELPAHFPEDVRERFRRSSENLRQEFNGEETALLRAMPPEDRKMFLICEYVSAAAGEYYNLGAKPSESSIWKVPDRFTKLTANFRLGVWDLRNPYTGEPLRNVPPDRPEPGAITYGPEFLPEGTDGPFRAVRSIICYGRDGKPVTPKHERRLRELLSRIAH